MPHQARQLFERARAEQWAIGAFNAANLETIVAIFRAAKALESPVIIESSPGETAYVGPTTMRALIDNYQATYDVQALLNLDHATDIESCSTAIEAGYELIHFDGGKLEERENVMQTRRVVKGAHQHHRLVEGELDHIAGSSTVHKKKSATVQDERTYTDPERAARFVAATGIDTLAVFVGNIHGLYQDAPVLDFDRLDQIREAVPSFLSLHGGSGICDGDVQRAIKAGITKVNVNSELRLAYLESLREAVKDPKEIAPYKYMEPVIDAVQRVAAHKIKVFGSAGKAKRQWTKRSL